MPAPVPCHAHWRPVLWTCPCTAWVVHRFCIAYHPTRMRMRPRSACLTHALIMLPSRLPHKPAAQPGWLIACGLLPPTHTTCIRMRPRGACSCPPCPRCDVCKLVLVVSSRPRQDAAVSASVLLLCYPHGNACAQPLSSLRFSSSLRLVSCTCMCMCVHVVHVHG